MSIIFDKIVPTRKAHICSACLREFPAGTNMRIQEDLTDGIIFTWRSCPTCEILISKYSDEFDDQGDLYEGCVFYSLDIGQSPEEKLKELTKGKK